jgi:ComF family protein
MPFAGAVASDDRLCVQCKLNPPRFNKAMSLWMFQGVAREIIHELKYKSGEYMLSDIESMVLKNRAMVELVSNAVLVPVPIHWRRFFSRGYNQSELIAKGLCRVVQNSVVKNLLIKKRHNRSQTELDPEARVKNVVNSFALRKDIDFPKNTKLVIVDDVMTTGATINECVRELQEGGYSQVFVMTLARG